MGLPLRLPLKRPPRTSAPRLPPLVQPAPTTQLDRRPTTDQPRLTGLWVLQLGAEAEAERRALAKQHLGFVMSICLAAGQRSSLRVFRRLALENDEHAEMLVR